MTEVCIRSYERVTNTMTHLAQSLLCIHPSENHVFFIYLSSRANSVPLASNCGCCHVHVIEQLSLISNNSTMAVLIYTPCTPPQARINCCNSLLRLHHVHSLTIQVVISAVTVVFSVVQLGPDCTYVDTLRSSGKRLKTSLYAH